MNFPAPPPRHRLASAYLFLVGRGNLGQPIISSWLNQLSIPPIDVVELKGTDRITIAEVRELKRALLLAPTSGLRVGVVLDAGRLTLEAGNALLKLLEDPPPHVVLLLTAGHEDQLLPTIVSRCQRWRIRRQKTEDRRQSQTEWEIGQINRMTYRERFRLAEEWAKSDRFVERFDELIQAADRALKQGTTGVDAVAALLTKRILAETNVSPRLLAEATLLQIPRGD